MYKILSLKKYISQFKARNHAQRAFDLLYDGIQRELAIDNDNTENDEIEGASIVHRRRPLRLGF
jgi:hypothetical protein